VVMGEVVWVAGAEGAARVAEPPGWRERDMVVLLVVDKIDGAELI
jgi:hypothetical protein